MKNIGYVLTIGCKMANPNGNPDDENRPRTLSDGRGYITDVCMKHKFRNALSVNGESILISQDSVPKGDSASNVILKEMEKEGIDIKSNKDLSKFDERRDWMCGKYFDVRAFGHCLTTLTNEKKALFNRGVTGAITVTMAESIKPINILTSPITKCIDEANGEKHDTMGEKHCVENAIYTMMLHVNGPALERNRGTEADIPKIENALLTMFENDASAARPSGSMGVISCVKFEYEKNCSMFDIKKEVEQSINEDGVFDKSFIEKIATKFGCDISFLK